MSFRFANRFSISHYFALLVSFFYPLFDLLTLVIILCTSLSILLSFLCVFLFCLRRCALNIFVLLTFPFLLFLIFDITFLFTPTATGTRMISHRAHLSAGPRAGPWACPLSLPPGRPCLRPCLQAYLDRPLLYPETKPERQSLSTFAQKHISCKALLFWALWLLPPNSQTTQHVQPRSGRPSKQYSTHSLIHLSIQPATAGCAGSVV